MIKRRRRVRKRIKIAVITVFAAILLTAIVLVCKKWWPVWEQNVFSYIVPIETSKASSAQRPTYAPAATPAPTPVRVNASATAQPTTTPEPEPVLTDWSYSDKSLSIDIKEVDNGEVVYYVAHVRFSNTSLLRTAFAEDKFGDYHEYTSSMTERNGGLFAINGDYYGFRDEGIIIRNGVLYRDNPRSRQMAVFFNDGSMEVYDKNQCPDGETLLAMGAVQSWAFGPWLIKDGVMKTDFSDGPKINGRNPRAGIGMVEPGHLVCIVVDGRTDESDGMKLGEFAQTFVDEGCVNAYNLDGGGSATMYFNGRLVNYPGGSGRERKISDCLFFAPAEPIDQASREE